jgi:hypothetical protein
MSKIKALVAICAVLAVAMIGVNAGTHHHASHPVRLALKAAPSM